MNLIINKTADSEKKDKNNPFSKQVGEYQVTYHFSGGRSLEDCVSEYVRKKLKK